MATVYKRPNSPYYLADFLGADGRRIRRSTKQKRKGPAMAVAAGWEATERKRSYDLQEAQGDIAALVAKAGSLAAQRRLTVDAAREILLEIYRQANAEEWPAQSVRQWLDGWAEGKAKTVSTSAAARYRLSIRGCLEALGKRADIPLELLRTDDVAMVRDKLAETGVCAATVNYKLQDLKAAIRKACVDGLVSRDVAAGVEYLPAVDSRRRGPFGLEEVQALMEVASDDWRGAILLATHTGLRLSNVSSLDWSNVDFTAGEIVVQLVKQRLGRDELTCIPMSPALEAWLRERMVPSGNGPVFPELWGSRPGNLSYRFTNIMERAAVPKTVTDRGGRELHRSFHSLRHTFVTLLAAKDVPAEIRRKLAGHKSESVHEIYTHADTLRLRAAIAALPDL